MDIISTFSDVLITVSHANMCFWQVFLGHLDFIFISLVAEGYSDYDQDITILV